MKIKIAVPDNQIYQDLYRKVDDIKDEYNIELIKAGEKETRELMLTNRADLALLSPLGYGLGVTAADYRIVPGRAMSVYGYTGMASIFFKEGAETLTKAASAAPDDFLLLLGKILLAENYSMNPEVKQVKATRDIMLRDNDCAIVWDSSSGKDKALDISEEWFFLYYMPLPLAFWVCREEEYPPEVLDIIRKLASPDLIPEEEVVDNEALEYGDRVGAIIWEWSDTIENALDEILQLLYFHQMIPEIPGIKILGRDDDIKITGTESD
jgi:predicted solute-binding protein